MTTKILIITPTFSDIDVETAQESIVQYLGTKNAIADPMYPVVNINCDICQSDIEHLESNMKENTHLIVFVGKSSLTDNFIYY